MGNKNGHLFPSQVAPAPPAPASQRPQERSISRDSEEDDVSVESVHSISTKFETALESLDERSLDRFAGCSSWIEAIQITMEDLPVSFSISSATTPGFPLLYVNKTFEKVTGFSREEVVGRNCKFLQRDNLSESESIQRLSTALRLGLPIKVAITNTRKNGEVFQNLLAMKPIHDELGNYLFVVGMLFDVQSSSFATLKLTDQVLTAVPNVIPNDVFAQNTIVEDCEGEQDPELSTSATSTCLSGSAS
jgi:PAS domain S-box-containing protein